MLPVLAAAPQQDHLPCPRCGEPVPASHWRHESAGAIRAGVPKGMPGAFTATPGPQPSVPRDTKGIRKTAFIILSVMLVMAVVGLSYMLWTVKFRRARDPQRIQPPVAFRHPLELPGLGYLPRGCQVVAGWQVAEMRDDKAGASLLATPPTFLDWLAKQIQRTSGLKIEELDHVVAAVSFDPKSALSLQLVLVVKTREDYAGSRIVAVPGTLKSELKGRPLHEIAFDPLPGLLWHVEKRTLLYEIRPFAGPKAEPLANLSEIPRLPGDLLSPPLREALAERLQKRQFLWCAGRVDQLDALKKQMPFWPGPLAELSKTRGIKTAALGLEPVKGLTLTGYFHMTDAKAAESYKTMLEGVRFEGTTATVVTGPDQWVTWQVRGEVEPMRALLNDGGLKR
jgi:hypothetical protein